MDLIKSIRSRRIVCVGFSSPMLCAKWVFLIEIPGLNPRLFFSFSATCPVIKLLRFGYDFLAWRNPAKSKFEVKNKAETNRYKHISITIWVNRERYGDFAVRL